MPAPTRFRCAVLSAVKHDYVARGLTSHPRFEVVVVADHTKIGRQALAFLCELAAVDTLIVDNALSEPQRALLDQNDVRVLVAGPEQPTEEFRP